MILNYANNPKLNKQKLSVTEIFYVYFDSTAYLLLILPLKKKGLHRCKPYSIWWVVRDLNPGPKDYESSALTN